MVGTEGSSFYDPNVNKKRSTYDAGIPGNPLGKQPKKDKEKMAAKKDKETKKATDATDGASDGTEAEGSGDSE